MIKKYWINNHVRLEQETNNNVYFNLHANRYSCQYKEQLRLTSVFFDFEHCLYFKSGFTFWLYNYNEARSSEVYENANDGVYKQAKEQHVCLNKFK